jgi:hypothetical protein
MDFPDFSLEQAEEKTTSNNNPKVPIERLLRGKRDCKFLLRLHLKSPSCGRGSLLIREKIFIAWVSNGLEQPFKLKIALYGPFVNFLKTI